MKHSAIALSLTLFLALALFAAGQAKAYSQGQQCHANNPVCTGPISGG